MKANGGSSAVVVAMLFLFHAPAYAGPTSLAADAIAVAEGRLWSGEIGAGLQVLDRSLARTGRGEERAALLAERGKLYAFQLFVTGRGRNDALSDLEESERLAEASGVPLVLADALTNHGFVLYTAAMTGGEEDFTTARNLFERALEIRIGHHDGRGMAESHFYLGLVSERSSNVEQARQHYQTSLELARCHRSRLEESYALRHLGFLDQAEGMLDQALRNLQQSLRLREEIGFRIYLPFSHLAIGGVLEEQGKNELAGEEYRAAKDLAEEMHLDRAVVLSHLSLGDLDAAAGLEDRARTHYRTAAELSATIGYSRGVELSRTRLQQLSK